MQTVNALETYALDDAAFITGFWSGMCLTLLLTAAAVLGQGRRGRRW